MALHQLKQPDTQSDISFQHRNYHLSTSPALCVSRVQNASHTTNMYNPVWRTNQRHEARRMPKTTFQRLIEEIPDRDQHRP